MNNKVDGPNTHDAWTKRYETKVRIVGIDVFKHAELHYEVWESTVNHQYISEEDDEPIEVPVKGFYVKIIKEIYNVNQLRKKYYKMEGPFTTRLSRAKQLCDKLSRGCVFPEHLSDIAQDYIHDFAAARSKRETSWNHDFDKAASLLIKGGSRRHNSAILAAKQAE